MKINNFTLIVIYKIENTILMSFWIWSDFTPNQISWTLRKSYSMLNFNLNPVFDYIRLCFRSNLSRLVIFLILKTKIDFLLNVKDYENRFNAIFTWRCNSLLRILTETKSASAIVKSYNCHENRNSLHR